MKRQHNQPTIVRILLLGLAFTGSALMGVSAVSQTPCTLLPTANISHFLTHNTDYGGHVTAHVYGTQPPASSTQNGRTLFRDAGDYYEAWETLEAQDPPLYCAQNPQLGAEAARDVPVQFFSYRCLAADTQGRCTRTQEFQSNTARFIFRSVEREGRIRWILYTAYPAPQ